MVTRKNNIAMLGFFAMLPASVALAGGIAPTTTVTTSGSAKDTVNRGYVGLKWTLGQGPTPAVVVGLRRATVKSNGDTSGGDISFSFNLATAPARTSCASNISMAEKKYRAKSARDTISAKGSSRV